MAFDYTNLYPDTSSNGGYTKSWNYTTLDLVAVVTAPGYFNKVATRLGIGDTIVVAVVDAFDTKFRTAVVDATNLLVTTIAGGVVTTRVFRPGLDNVDNTSDATKNAAVATLTNKTISSASNTITYTTPARSQTKTFSALTTTYINAALEGVPSDGLSDAAAGLQAVVTWVAANRPNGAFIDCSDGVFRFDSTVTISSNDVVIGGAGPGQLANFHRNHDVGPLFKFTAPGTGGTQITRSGLHYCAVRDLGTATNGNGQRTGLVGTFANSPYGVIFETVDQPVVAHIEFYNESLGMFGAPNARPSHMNWFFNRVLDTGRIAWNFTGGTLSATAFPRASGCWGNTFDIEAGIINGGTIFPSCDFGLVVDQCDGFYLDQIHSQYTNVAHVYLPGNTSGRGLTNFGLSNAYLDLCTGDGLRIFGSVAIQSLQFNGIISGGGFGSSKSGVNITNPIDEAVFDIERLEGFTGFGVLIQNANAKNIDINLRSARRVGSNIIAVGAGNHISIRPGNLNGNNAADTAALATNGIYLGANAAEVHISGGRVSNCTNGIVFDTGATFCSATGVNVRNNYAIAITNIGTNTAAKANIGATDI